MRVRIKDGRAGQLTTRHAARSHGLPVVVLDDGTALGPAECGPLETAASTRSTLRLAALAQVAGYRFAGVVQVAPVRARMAKSAARSDASRANGAKGGRPRKRDCGNGQIRRTDGRLTEDEQDEVRDLLVGQERG